MRLILLHADARSVKDIDDELMTGPCPPVNLLVRTSGEIRLSDFLLWQARFLFCCSLNLLTDAVLGKVPDLFCGCNVARSHILALLCPFDVVSSSSPPAPRCA